MTAMFAGAAEPPDGAKSPMAGAASMARAAIIAIMIARISAFSRCPATLNWYLVLGHLESGRGRYSLRRAPAWGSLRVARRTGQEELRQAGGEEDERRGLRMSELGSRRLA